MGATRRKDLFSQLDGLGDGFDVETKPAKRSNSKRKKSVKTRASSLAMKSRIEMFEKPESIQRSPPACHPIEEPSIEPSYVDDIWDYSNTDAESTECEEGSTHTAETSIFLDSPPRKNQGMLARRNETELSISPASGHNLFQNKLRIGSSTINNLSVLLECVEALVLSDTTAIEGELESFISTIQESSANNTYKINLFPGGKMYRKSPYKDII